MTLEAANTAAARMLPDGGDDDEERWLAKGIAGVQRNAFYMHRVLPGTMPMTKSTDTRTQPNPRGQAPRATRSPTPRGRAAAAADQFRHDPGGGQHGGSQDASRRRRRRRGALACQGHRRRRAERLLHASRPLATSSLPTWSG